MDYDIGRPDPAAGKVLNHVNLNTLKNNIRAHGVACEVRKGTVCPCVNPETEQPRFNCSVCHGIGFFFDEPLVTCDVTDGKHRIAMSARQLTKELRASGGYYQHGDHQAIIYTFTPAYGDLIRPLADVEVINSEQHVKGGLLLDGSSAEVLYHSHVLAVEYILVINSGLNHVLKYRPGINFNLVGNQIVWIDGTSQPATGTKYIVRYTANPSYIIMSVQPSFLTEHDEGTPQRVRETIDTIMPYQATLLRLDRRAWKNKEIENV